MPESKTYVITSADTIASPPRPKPNVPDHELIHRIGSGAYGEVWLARNVVGTFRAVKVVYRDSFDNDGPYEREYRGIQKFEPISRSNDGFVDVLQIGRNDQEGLFYYVMELADDASAKCEVRNPEFALTAPSDALSHSMEEGRGEDNGDRYVPKTLHSEIKLHSRLPFEECLRFAMSLNLALGHLHRQGLIHRDIKPSNIIFVGGVPKLADIGLVTEVEDARTFVGTEGFIPPEGPNSPRADIYSLGKVLYEMSMGKDRTEFPEPFTALGQAPASQELEELNTIILKACATNPRDRYQSAEEMHVDLALLQDGKSVKSKRILERRLAFASKAGAMVGVIALIATGAFSYQRFQTREAKRLAQAEAFQRTRAESLLSTLQSKEAEHLFENDDANKGVAYLAHLLRQNPTNEIVGSRLMSALTDRSFPLPVRTFQRSGIFRRVDFSPNGGRFVTWSRNSNGIAELWDVGTGKIVGKPMIHSAPLLSARFSPDGRFIATLATNGDARVWNAADAEPLGDTLRHPALRDISRTVYHCVTFSPDGERLATVSGTEVRIWSVRTGKLLIGPLEHGEWSTDVEFSPDGELLASSGQHKVKVWHLSRGTLRYTLDIGDGDPDCLARFSPDGRRIVGMGGFIARVWDVESGALLFKLPHGMNVSSARFSPDGTRIATADADGAVRLWNANNGQLLFSPFVHGISVQDVQFDRSGKRLLTWEWLRARVWDTEKGRPISEWILENSEIAAAEFSPGGETVLTVSGKNATVWDVRPGQASNIKLWHGTMLVPSAHFNRDGTRIVTASGGDIWSWARDNGPFETAVWDSKTGELSAPVITLSREVQYAEFSPDGRRIITACKNGEAQVWDAQTSAAVGQVMKHQARVRTARFSPDGSRVITASDDKTARVWDVQTGQPITSPIKHTDSVFVAEFSADGQSILTVSLSDGARIWDAQTGSPRQSGFVYGSATTSGCFSPDGRLIATGSGNGTAQIWNIMTGKVVGEPLNHKDVIPFVRFSPNGRYLATASEDQTARVWDVQSGKPIAEPLQHKGAVLTVEFSSDSRHLVTASIDGTARVWDVATGRPLTEPLRENAWVASAEFSPDGTRVVVASANRAARIWRLPPARAPFPKWIPDLAEVIAGERWTDKHVFEGVASAEYLAHRAKLLQMRETDEQSRWMKWLLADRAARTVSYASSAIATGIRHPPDIPPRNPTAKPEQINLDAFYNAGLKEHWHGSKGSDLASLPAGVQTLSGVPWDIRGLIQLGAESDGPFPERVSGIPVGFLCQRAHFLHAATRAADLPDGTQIGNYIAHFVDGEQIEIPIVIGRDLGYWKNRPDDTGKPFVIAWTGISTNTSSVAEGRDIRLFKTTWENPLPEVPLRSIDLISTHGRAAPFVVAITAERTVTNVISGIDQQ